MHLNFSVSGLPGTWCQLTQNICTSDMRYLEERGRYLHQFEQRTQEFQLAPCQRGSNDFPASCWNCASSGISAVQQARIYVLSKTAVLHICRAV